MKSCILKPIWIFFFIMTLCRITYQADNDKNSQIQKINYQTLYIMVPHIIDEYSVVQGQKLAEKTDNRFTKTKKVDYFVQKQSANKPQGKDIVQSANIDYDKQLINQKEIQQQTKKQSIQKMIAEQRQRIYKEISQISERQNQQSHQDYFQYLLYALVGILFAVILISKSKKRKHSIPVQNDESVQFKSDRLQQVGPQNQSDSSDEGENQISSLDSK